MAQKPYKHNIEYIQKYYSYGSEAKVLELKPVHREEPKPALPKRKKEPVTTICIDPIAFCGVMVAIVMLVVVLAGVIQFNIASEDHAVMTNYVNHLTEQNILLSHQFTARCDLTEIDATARALGMIPVEEAKTISMTVVTPIRHPEPNLWDDIVWFFSGLFA